MSEEKLKEQLRNLEITTKEALKSKESAIATLVEFGIISQADIKANTSSAKAK